MHRYVLDSLCRSLYPDKLRFSHFIITITIDLYKLNFLFNHLLYQSELKFFSQRVQTATCPITILILFPPHDCLPALIIGLWSIVDNPFCWDDMRLSLLKKLMDVILWGKACSSLSENLYEVWGDPLFSWSIDFKSQPVISHFIDD